MTCWPSCRCLRAKTLAAATNIQVNFQAIEGDVFEDQRTDITKNQGMNEQAMLDELVKLPTLTSLLATLLDELLQSPFPGLDQSQTRLNFYSVAQAHDGNQKKCPDPPLDQLHVLE